MATSSNDCSFTRRIVSEIRQEINGINNIFKAYLASLIIGFLFAVIAVAAALSAGNAAGAASALFAVSGISALVNAVIMTPLLYKGFRLLASIDTDYGIGVKGSIIWGVGETVVGIALVILAAKFPENIENMGTEELVSIITRDLLIIVAVGLIAFIGSIMLLIALWRLGDAHSEHGGDVLKIGLVLWIIGSILQLLHVRGGGLLGFIGGLILLYGLHRVSTGLENILSEKEYELSRCSEGMESE